MKKIFLTTAFFAFSLIIIGPGCSGSKTENKEQKAAEHYQCPMKCTEEIFTKPGKCPVCEMDLEKISNS